MTETHRLAPQPAPLSTPPSLQLLHAETEVGACAGGSCTMPVPEKRAGSDRNA